ncbi:nucleotidyltransferase [Arsenicitalea aurantiaca]|uniref:Nucleotidyltransferase n=1 Tax=Arsenicitalea aurantiaca TaxID=1783274 RepID=A0A433X8F6_9HYPH|nr:nucleotidyltransferase [Arsenicitalea aurantiaca]RUT30355.1 nucleotidyltransferase [Arsenicitalea aurantiaca]
MTADDYLKAILEREAVPRDPGLLPAALVDCVGAICRDWAGPDFLEIVPAGSFEKGTANLSGRQIDFLAVLAPDTARPLEEAYAALWQRFEALGLRPERRNVSIGIRVSGRLVDVIPARREARDSDAHMLFLPRAGKTVTTMPALHAGGIGASGLTDEIRLMKLWRDQRGLPFPSFYLELSVLAALDGQGRAGLAENVWAVLVYLERSFLSRAVLDPANANNIVSDMLAQSEKSQIAASARRSLADAAWQEIVA